MEIKVRMTWLEEFLLFMLRWVMHWDRKKSLLLNLITPSWFFQ